MGRRREALRSDVRRGAKELVAARALWAAWLLALWPLSRRAPIPDDGLTSVAASAWTVAAVVGIILAVAVWWRMRHAAPALPVAPRTDWLVLAASGGMAGLAVKLLIEGVTADPASTVFVYFLTPVFVVLAASQLGEPPRRVLLVACILLLGAIAMFLPELRARGAQRPDRALLCAVGATFLYTTRALAARRLLDRHRVPTIFAWEAAGAAAVLLAFAAGAPRPGPVWAVVCGVAGVAVPGLLFLSGMRRAGVAAAGASQWVEAAVAAAILAAATLAI